MKNEKKLKRKKTLCFICYHTGFCSLARDGILTCTGFTGSYEDWEKYIKDSDKEE